MAKRPAPLTITAQRASRLYKLLAQIAEADRPRATLLRRLRVDLRGFYRDLELLRSLGVDVHCDGDRYRLLMPLPDALARLPFPDPGLSLRDALLLAEGRTDAHRKLRTRIHAFIGPNGTANGHSRA